MLVGEAVQGGAHAKSGVEWLISGDSNTPTMAEKKRGKLTLEEFQAAARGTQLSDVSREAARLVLVDGMQQKEAGIRMGMREPRVSIVVSRIWKEHESRSHELKEKVGLVEADFDFAVRALRQSLGDTARIQPAEPDTRYAGTVVDRSAFFLFQDLGRNTVVAHKLSQLDVVPAVGDRVTIAYGADGRGVVAQPKERSRSGHSR